MITYKTETVAQLKEDIQPLIELHWQEIARNKDAIKLNPNYAVYKTLEDAGILHCIAVRDNEKLIGYSISIINGHPHYMDHMYATNDILYVHPDYRRGGVGMQLIAKMIKTYKKRNVSIVHIHMKNDFDFSPLMKRAGFKAVETNWELRLI